MNVWALTLTRWSGPVLFGLGLALTGPLGCARGVPGSGTGSVVDPLVERVDARIDAPEGTYPEFTVAADRGVVETADGPRIAFTPPFPGTILLEVTVPDSGRLRFYPALVTRQDVRRAMVDFVVRVDAEVVFRETLEFGDTNRWHERDVDLSSFSGREVTLAFETRPFRGGADKLWADRVQTAWGSPELRGGAASASATGAEGPVRELEAWLQSEAPSLGFDASAVVRFAVNLLLGGVLALLVRGLYLHVEPTSPARRTFAGLFPLFTLATILVITVVEVSVALSLGLLGALSIVRFRSSIRAPRQIAYLLFCVGVGLCLGAGEPSLAGLVVVFVSSFELARFRFWPETRTSSAFVLTLSGEARHFFEEGAEPVLTRLRKIAPHVSFRRLERRGERVELSAIVHASVDGGAGGSRALSLSLVERFPDLDITCVDADAIQ